jgi:hypothetical protein
MGHQETLIVVLDGFIGQLHLGYAFLKFLAIPLPVRIS